MFRPAPTFCALSTVAAALLVGGCKPQPVAGSAVATTVPKPAPRRDAGAPPAPKLDEIPAALRNDAYAYYGLGRTKPITMNVTSRGSTSPGSQDVRLLSVTPEEAKFEIISTDALEIMGRNVLSLRADGIRVAESDVTTTSPTEFELPADLKPGSTWTVNQSSAQGARAMRLTLTQKVIGTERLKTKVAEYPDALRVDGTGSGTLQGKPVTIRTQSWFVRDRGNVKYTIEQTVAGKTDSTSVEEIP